MEARIASASVAGMTATPLMVKAHFEEGLPRLMVRGVAGYASDVASMVRMGLRSAGFVMPDRQVVVDVGPEDR